jgi:Putative Flp pilus-assembly TadE/G-like
MRSRAVSTHAARGQILIVTAAALFVLMAVAALVVDLGFSWMLHRQEQNAADPASIAAARWLKDPTGVARSPFPEAYDEACFYAKANGFFAGDTNDCDAARASGELQVNWPPVGEPYSGHRGKVQVIISSTHPSFFAQVFGQDWARVTTGAVAANEDGNSNSSSLVALGSGCTGSDSGDSAITGGGTVHLFAADPSVPAGGYVQVNAACGNATADDACLGGGGTDALAISGSLQAPFTSVVGSCGRSGSGSQPVCEDPAVVPCLDEASLPLGDPLAGLPEPWPILGLAVPACPKASEVNGPSDWNPCTLKGGSGASATCPMVGTQYTCTMNPGVYYAGWDVQSNVKVVMKPGMYVFAGFGIKLTSGASMETISDVDGTGQPIDARVTIFSTDYTAGCQAGRPNFCQGSIDISAQGALRLKATNETTCQQVSPQICPWKGILLWQDGTTVQDPADVSITGGSDLVLSGTIYAPESFVKIAGSNGSTGCLTGTSPQACLAVQIISESWEIHGSATVDMPYDPSELYQFPARGLIH